MSEKRPMPYRIRCNGVNREGVKASSDLAYRFFFIYHFTNFDMASVFSLAGVPEQHASNYTHVLLTFYITVDILPKLMIKIYS